MSSPELNLDLQKRPAASLMTRSTDEIGNIRQSASSDEVVPSFELWEVSIKGNSDDSASAGETSEEEDQYSSQVHSSPSLSSCASVSDEYQHHGVTINNTNDIACNENGPGEYSPSAFEGPEKTMEVRFRSVSPLTSHEDGLRGLTRSQLDKICGMARCSILSHISNNYLDAYVLSESSLFVYKDKLMMKTCGTTTLLCALSTICDYASGVGLELVWLEYSRKNLFYPEAQSHPHRSCGEEVKYLEDHPCLQGRMKGHAHVLGPITGDHWFVYVAEQHEGVQGQGQGVTSSVSAPHPRRQKHGLCLNIMMFDMQPGIAQPFYRPEAAAEDKDKDKDKDASLSSPSRCPVGVKMTTLSGIDSLVPGMQLDEHAFEPCGYSLNAILHDAYSTIHVTPEEESSYVSFETNVPLRSYDALVRNVIHTFQPKRYVLTLWVDEYSSSTGGCGGRSVISPMQATAIPYSAKSRNKDKKGQECYYVREAHSSSYLNGTTVVHMANYRLHESSGACRPCPDSEADTPAYAATTASASTSTAPAPAPAADTCLGPLREGLCSHDTNYPHLPPSRQRAETLL